MESPSPHTPDPDASTTEIEVTLKRSAKPAAARAPYATPSPPLASPRAYPPRAAAPAVYQPPVVPQPANPPAVARLESEKVVVAAPLSFAGSGARIWKITQTDNPAARVGLICLAIVLIAIAWTFVLCWYLFWGIWLVPYRLIRRGSRQRKRQALQHREMLSAIQQQNAQQHKPQGPQQYR